MSDVDRMIEETKTIEEIFREDEEKYVGLTAEELKKLPDEELMNALLTRTEYTLDALINKAPAEQDAYSALKTALELLNEHQRLFYAVTMLETEVNNGGLCQFFENSSRIAAPLVSGYMEIIGAAEHKKLYDDFLAKHAIDPANLPDFDEEAEKDGLDIDEKYAFDEYDDAFYEMEPLETYLLAYAKAHLDSF